MSEEKNVAIALPGEWVLQKVFGPVLSEVGEDIKKVYAKGRERLITTAYRKISDENDGKQANRRVTRDVMWNGAFTEDEVCAEYFGGLLASSRSIDGKDDDVIQFVDVVKSLSSRQLRLHYILYHSLNLQLAAEEQPVNVGQSTELNKKPLWLASRELVDRLDLRIETDLNILHRQGLLIEYKMDSHQLDLERALPYTMIKPTVFGILLYSAAHNKLSEWRRFSSVAFGDFPGIELPVLYSASLEGLVAMVQPELSNANEDSKDEA
jgi:hypothetical protein